MANSFSTVQELGWTIDSSLVNRVAVTSDLASLKISSRMEGADEQCLNSSKGKEDSNGKYLE